mgnify:CR=1 FL=1
MYTEKQIEKIITDNSNMIHHIINKMVIPPHIEEQDLVQIGMIAMFQSINRYKPGKGQKLSSYMYNEIRWKIVNYLKDNALSYGKPRGALERMSYDERQEFIRLHRPIQLDSISMGRSKDIDYANNVSAKADTFENSIIEKVYLEKYLKKEEIRHLNLVNAGYTKREIADELGICYLHEIRIRKKLKQKLERVGVL